MLDCQDVVWCAKCYGKGGSAPSFNLRCTESLLLDSLVTLGSAMAPTW